MTTLVFATIGSGIVRSLFGGGNRGELDSVGVGGVLTIIGALWFSDGGGVDGAEFVPIG